MPYPQRLIHSKFGSETLCWSDEEKARLKGLGWMDGTEAKKEEAPEQVKRGPGRPRKE